MQLRGESGSTVRILTSSSSHDRAGHRPLYTKVVLRKTTASVTARATRARVFTLCVAPTAANYLSRGWLGAGYGASTSPTLTVRPALSSGWRLHRPRTSALLIFRGLSTIRFGYSPVAVRTTFVFFLSNVLARTRKTWSPRGILRTFYGLTRLGLVTSQPQLAAAGHSNITSKVQPCSHILITIHISH